MRKFFLSLSLFLCIASYGQTHDSVQDSVEINVEKLADLIIKEAESYLGRRYSYGGTGTLGFDCSGFTYVVYRKFGYTLARSSKGQALQGRAVEGSITQLQKGDLIIMGSRRRSKTVGHVGIFIEMDSTGTDFKFIHASTSGGVTISRMKEPYYDGRFLGARRFIPDFIKTDTTTKDYGFEIENTVLPPDTLHLKESESRIVILENGKWAYVASDGKISEPTGSEKIVLDCATGNWSIIKATTKQIPTASASPTSPNPAPSDSSGAIYHTIKSGDSLYALAKKYKTTVKAICNLNGITEKTVLRIGKKIRVK